MRSFLALVIALASLVAPVAGAQGAERWVTHRSTGFTIQLPASWADATGDRQRILEESRRLVDEDPELARIIDGLLAAGTASSAVRMFAFDLDRASLRSGFATNLNVIRERTSLSAAEWRRESLEALVASRFVQEPVWSKVVKLPAGKALRLTYRARFTVAGKRLVVAITQFGIVRPGSATILTYTTLPALSASYRPTFDRSARSLRFR